MKDLEAMVAWTMDYCQHYEMRGMPKTCLAGVEYDKVGKIIAVLPGNEKRDDARPCVKGHLMPDALQRCPKWIRKTREQGEARYHDLQESMRQMRLVGPIVSKWRTWSKKNRVAKAEAIECPACGGRLHLSQAAYNGHIHGQCETAGCVSWME
jgi:hypothetical protein